MLDFFKDVIGEASSILPHDPTADTPVSSKSPLAKPSLSPVPTEKKIPEKFSIKSTYEWTTQDGAKLRFKVMDVVDNQHAIQIEMWNEANPNRYIRKTANVKQLQYLLKTAKSWSLVTRTW